MITEINWNNTSTKKDIEGVNNFFDKLSKNKFNMTPPKVTIEIEKFGYFVDSDLLKPLHIELTRMWKDLTLIFNELNLVFLPSGGTLLGLERDGEIIKHDDDLDSLVEYHEILKVENEFLSLLDKHDLVPEINWHLIHDLVKEGMWNNYTKVLSKNYFRFIIGDHYFEFRPFCDMFQLVRFNNFEEYFEIFKSMIDAFATNRKNKWVIKRNLLMLNKLSGIRYHKKNYFKLRKFLKESYERDDSYYSEENMRSKYEDFRKKIRDNKNDGKYFVPLNFLMSTYRKREFDNIIAKKSRENIVYKGTNEDLKYLRKQYGRKWKENPGKGPMHELNGFRYKGKYKKNEI